MAVTPRLLVRRFEARDAATLHAYRNDPAIARWQGWAIPYPRSEADALVRTMSAVDLFRRGDWTQLAIARRDDSGLIGDVGIRVEPDEPTAEIGFTLAAPAQGHGYGTEAVGAVIEHLLVDRGFARVIAITAVANDRAQRLLERVGLRAVAVDGDELVYLRRAPG